MWRAHSSANAPLTMAFIGTFAPNARSSAEGTSELLPYACSGLASLGNAGATKRLEPPGAAAAPAPARSVMWCAARERCGLARV